MATTMMLLIDSDYLQSIKFHPLPYMQITPPDVAPESYKRGWNDVVDVVLNDADTVVRCGECVHGYRYFEAYGLDCLSCRKLVDKNGNGIEFPVLPDGYCSYGERKSDMSLGTDNSEPHMELEPITGEYARYHGELDVRNGTLTIYGLDRCVCCGEIIPEGRMVCPVCERRANE